jgi:hypothetical protein
MRDVPGVDDDQLCPAAHNWSSPGAATRAVPAGRSLSRFGRPPACACSATHPSVSLEEADARFRHRGALHQALGINGKHSPTSSAPNFSLRPKGGVRLGRARARIELIEAPAILRSGGQGAPRLTVRLGKERNSGASVPRCGNAGAAEAAGCDGASERKVQSRARPGTAFPIICSARPAAATTGSALAESGARTAAGTMADLPRCKSRQGWFRSLRRAMGGWWPRAECLR